MLVLVMGVAGSGKTTIGKALAQSMGWRFADADDFHSAANISKMSDGVALTDADRAPWLRTMQQAITAWIDSGESVVLACSALKQRYREQLISGDFAIVYLKGDLDLIYGRLAARREHFMRPEMLASQFADLEPPQPDEGATEVSVEPSPNEIVDTILKAHPDVS